MWQERIALDKDGMVSPPERPGHGLTLNETWFEEHHIMQGGVTQP
jgi:L-alanine-DL-glutamate epimerase-like enolase superfamily enzyme